MSIQTQVKDAATVRSACQRLNLPEPVQGKAKLYGGEVKGLAVKLPDWTYLVVCDTASGQVKYDNFGGRWKAQTRYLHYECAGLFAVCKLRDGLGESIPDY